MVSQTASTACQKTRRVPGLAIGEPGEVEDAEQHQQRVLDQREAPAPSSVFRPMLVFQRLLEEFERGQVARAQAQALQVEHLHERDQRRAAEWRPGWRR